MIQTPGTSLLGEALEPELDEISSEFQIPHLFIESPAFSENSMIGYDETTVRLMELFMRPDFILEQRYRHSPCKSFRL